MLRETLYKESPSMGAAPSSKPTTAPAAPSCNQHNSFSHTAWSKMYKLVMHKDEFEREKSEFVKE